MLLSFVAKKKMESCRDAIPENHIRRIRTQKFSIGKEEKNPLYQDLHHAVTSLSTELYTKDVHFLMELIQNAEDNQYPEGVEPTLEFVLTERDITRKGAPQTLLIFNNEVGFSNQNIDAICSVGCSTKKGKRRSGFIGEKGIGFKSVFLVSCWPHIFSNGYRVKFSEERDQDCGIGYIVPEWVDQEPYLSDIRDVYGSSKALPTTIIALPLKPDKVEAVKVQLSELHPELLLFLSKIKRLYVVGRDHDSDESDDVLTVSISSETDHIKMRDKNATSRMVQLAIKDKMSLAEEVCRYYVWREVFPVKLDNRVSARVYVDEWIITLAFPCRKRLTRGTSSVGVYAFLPTAMVTNFPFIIQADFILASSRETILFDSKWNLGILECVPIAFSNAFLTCVKDASSLFSVAQVYKFVPVELSPFCELNKIREFIKAELKNLNVVLCESFYGKRCFRGPSGVIRIPIEFRKILNQVKDKGVSLDVLSSLEKYVLHSSLDLPKYDAALQFLGIASSDKSFDWCAKCITSCNLVTLASDDSYLRLLRFIAQCKESCFRCIPLLKYSDCAGIVELCTLHDAKRQIIKVQYATQPELHVWLNKCNRELKCPSNMYFLSNSTQGALVRQDADSFLQTWLLHDAGMKSCSALSYAHSVIDFLIAKKDPKLTVSLAQFLYHSYRKNFMHDLELSQICQKLPVVDGSTQFQTRRVATLVPALGSEWTKLLGPVNPFVDQGYVDLGNVYSQSCQFAEEHTSENELLLFLSRHCGAVDIEKLSVPNAVLQVATSELTCKQAFLLLEWIRSTRSRFLSFPPKFLNSVCVGKWLKTLSGFNSPILSILPDTSARILFDMMNNFMKDFSIIDQEFYMNKIGLYENDLKFLGVSFGLDDVHKLVLDRTKSYALSRMSKECVFSFLMFLGYLKAKNMIDDEWLKVVKKGKWLVTSQGYSSPAVSILLPSEIEAEAVVRITRLPIIDEGFYGSKIASFSSELVLLGVVTDLEEISKLIADSMFLNLSAITDNSVLLILKCIRYSGSSSNALIEKIKHHRWLKTVVGVKCPMECILAEPSWSCLSSGIGQSFIDEAFYGDEIQSFKAELKAVGVAVEFNNAVKMIGNLLKSLASSSHLTSDGVISLLRSTRQLNFTLPAYASELCHYLSKVEWLKTRHGYRNPSESILFNSKWATISQFVDLPLIDDSFCGLSIYGFEDELKLMSVITDFDRGSAFVARGLRQPIESRFVTADCTISLLECIKLMMSTSNNQSLRDNFISNLKKSKWLKTTNGYKMPEECILWDVAWGDIGCETDIKTIDRSFYGDGISLYESELRVLGVKMDSWDVCSLLFGRLLNLSDTSTICSIYSFLNKFHWRQEDMDRQNCQVWIPGCAGEAKWVNSKCCVVRDRYNLFGARFYALDKFYQQDLLPIFSSAFGVPEFPSCGSYLDLWKSWVSRSNQQVTLLECCAFWSYIIDNWNSETQEILQHSLTHVPSTTSSSDEIFLARKEEVFVPDDFRISELICSHPGVKVPLLAWLPKCTTAPYVSPGRLANIYAKLGVKRISQSIQYSPRVVYLNCRRVQEKNELIRKGSDQNYFVLSCLH